MISRTHGLWQRIRLQIDHIHVQMASDIMVKAGKMTITFPALDDLEDVGQS